MQEGAVPIIFTHIQSCNRSTPHLEILRYSLRILCNASNHVPTMPIVASFPDAFDILTELMQVHRKREPVFTTALQVIHNCLPFIKKRPSSLKPHLRRLEAIFNALNSTDNTSKRRRTGKSTSVKQFHISQPIYMLKELLDILGRLNTKKYMH